MSRERNGDNNSSYECRDTHLVIDKAATWNEWKRIGRNVGVLLSSSPWYVADWVNFGESRFGEKYAQALDVTGLSPERLRVLAWVGNRYKPSRRRPALSFEVHRELAFVPDDETQDAYLELAEKNGWTAKEVREWKREQRGEEPQPSSNVYVVKFVFAEDLDEQMFVELTQYVAELAESCGAVGYRIKRPRTDEESE